MTRGLIHGRHLLVLLFAVALTGCTETVTLSSLLEEMGNRDALTYDQAGAYTLRQFSSYNRASASPNKPGWFANADMSRFIRVEQNSGRREFVLFDAPGPGAIVRWWMTFYKAQEGTLRVYLDQGTTPVFMGTAAQLLSGTMLAGPPFSDLIQKGAPRGEEGRDYAHNLYLPIPFAHHCKITYECDLIKTLYNDEGTPVPEGFYWPDIFYNIDYRAYTPSTRVESFSMESLRRTKPLLDRVAALLNEPARKFSDPRAFDKNLQPADSLVIEILGKNQSINNLLISLKTVNEAQALRSTIIKASFDGYETVWAPVGEFFGTGYSTRPHRTRMNSREAGGMMESGWIMPFRRHCRIVFVNSGREPVGISGSAGVTGYHWKSGTMYFGATWHDYNHVMSRDNHGSPFDLNFIDIRGRGVYVGDQVTLFNNTYKWWGEGDEKIFVDGEEFPSSFGTGSEDYYGYSFGREEPFSHPFLAQPEGEGNMHAGLTVNLRHRSLDAIPFSSSISSNIELWHWDSVCMNYALTAFWYARPPFNHNIRPSERSARLSVALKPGDIEKDDGLPGENTFYTAADFERVPKIDAHFHYLSADDCYIKGAIALNFKLLTPIWDGEEVSIDDQRRLAMMVRAKYPNDYAWFTTFPASESGEPGFTERTIDRIRVDLRNGATGVKIWKNIGMVIRDSGGRYLMVDDPAFKPIFDYLEDHSIPVIAHLGEPRDCWLPEGEMTDPSDVVYYRNNPQYYMLRHPEVPSYEEQIRARDHLLLEHPGLIFTGAHLGSLEWSIDELAARLDRFPQMKVDLAARLYHIQYQSQRNYDKVRAFMIKYQDRIVYGTDSEVHDIPGHDPEAVMAGLRKGWQAQWIYLATDSVMGVKGLRLPKPVIDKIYCRNARSLFKPIKIEP